VKQASAIIRVSTSKQCISQSAQQEMIEAWCQDNEYTLADVYVEAGVDGGTRIEDRPELRKAIDATGEGDVLVAATQDRIARDTLNFLLIKRELEDKGASLASCDGSIHDGDTPEADLMNTMLAAIATYEKAKIRQRTRIAKAHQAAQGRFLGGKVPYGLKAENGKLVRDEGTWTVVAMMQTWRNDMTVKPHGRSYQSIADRLNGPKYRILNVNGDEWSKQTVANTLNSVKEY